MSDRPDPDKSVWRKQARQRWRESCVESRQAATSAVAAHLESWLLSRPGGLLWFAPLPDEPDLLALGVALAAGGRPVFLPKVAGEELELWSWDGRASSLLPGAFGIGEPDPAASRQAAAGEISVAVLPGLAFDPETGIRLGRGAGYYDRLLARPGFAPVAVGVALPWQLAGPLPREPHDRPVDWLATPAGMWRVGESHPDGPPVTGPASGTTGCG